MNVWIINGLFTNVSICVFYLNWTKRLNVKSWKSTQRQDKKLFYSIYITKNGTKKMIETCSPIELRVNDIYFEKKIKIVKVGKIKGS